MSNPSDEAISQGLAKSDTGLPRRFTPHGDMYPKTCAFTLSCKSSLSSRSLLPGFVSSALSSLRLSHNRVGFADAHTAPSAFTLAETLIALVIIGIIAAITVPTIVAKQREQATVEKVKKFYSTISNAVKRAIVDTGLNVDEWDFGDGSDYNRDSAIKFVKYIKPYLVISKAGCAGTTTGLCYSTLITKRLNGGEQVRYYSNYNYYKILLNDGSVFWLRTNGKDEYGKCRANGQTSNVCALVWYDINGTKEPNTIGKDTFYFFITPNGVIPHPDDDCVKGSNGWGCGGYILKNGNMDYLH